jgi:tetratricopeptide (TPR) repeat protein
MIAISLDSLANLHRVQGRYGEAEPLYHQALELRRQRLGDVHPDVATSLDNLATLYHAQSFYNQQNHCLLRH